MWLLFFYCRKVGVGVKVDDNRYLCNRCADSHCIRVRSGAVAYKVKECLRYGTTREAKAEDLGRCGTGNMYE